MSVEKISPLDQKRFAALVGPSRSPIAAFFSREIGWFANHDESVIGTLILDVVDHDFSIVLLGRDEIGRYRCFDQEVSIETPQKAYELLIDKMKAVTLTGEKVFPQGGDGGVALDIFSPIKPENKLHPYFKVLYSQPSHVAARGIIREMMPHYVDIDGNFVEQFQTTGFDARVWELYLNAYLVEEELFFDRAYNAPDFIVQKYGHTVAIEATIVGRKTPLAKLDIGELPELSAEDIAAKSRDEMPIRFGSPLYSKLKKEYWKLEQVAGNPFIIAIADFHEQQSMLWTSTSLITYLYGVRHDHHYDESGKLIITPQKVDTHKNGDKEIPSGFFFQPDTENISAIMFSASGTISKFNRLGKQAGFGQESVKMFRMGTIHDHDPNASMPKMFYYEVDETCGETWAEGMNLFHNPNAIYPVPEELFPSIAHHHFKDDMIVSNLPEVHVYSSMTQILNIVSDEEWGKKKGG
jgi:hypothetical protein